MANETRVGNPATAVGGLRAGPLNTPLPTDATSVLDAALEALGFIGDEGLTESENRGTDEVDAWGGRLARKLQTKWGLEVTFIFLERRTAVLKQVRGAENVIEEAVQGGIQRTVLYNRTELPRQVYVADIKDGKRKIRKVYPQAQITEVGETQWSSKSLVQYEVTLTCYEDDNEQAEYEYEFIPDEDNETGA